MKQLLANLALAVSASVLIATAATAAPTCTPACPKGQVCAWKDANGGGGQTVCKTPIILPNCGNDPLCGLDHGRKRRGSFQGSQVSQPSLGLSR